MIVLDKIFKTFKSGNNIIKAIDNTTLEFKDNGLVALLGPSGCGKTTILNAIGGLDRVDKGTISVDGVNYNNVKTIDNVRNLNIGYIFQDYKLVNNLSVYDNVAIVLKMIGVKNEEEIKNRVLYVLNKVGMERYKKRMVSMLSGGEKQRVAIARALVKDPKIILADEPTGNLDSKNSLEIMKIISSIASERLVILVTHEKRLAHFYANRIIEIEDGKVTSDYLNNHSDDLDYEVENNIYLKDFKNISVVNNELYDIMLYSDGEGAKISLVIKNGNVYIKSDKKVAVIDEHSNIELVDAKYEAIKKGVDNKYDFNLEDTIITKDKKYSSIFKFFDIFKNGFNKVFKYSFFKKILLLGFFMAGMFTFFSISSFIGSKDYNETNFLTYNRDYVLADVSNLDFDIDAIKNIDGVLNVLFNNGHFEGVYNYNAFIQSYSVITQFASFALFDDHEIIYGDGIEASNEVLMDVMIFDSSLNINDDYKMLGYSEVSDYIGFEVEINDKVYTIVGITDTGSPSYYIADDTLIDLFSYNGIGYYDDEEIIGTAPGYKEVIVGVGSASIGDYILIGDDEYLVVGTYNGILNLFNKDYYMDYLYNNSESLAINTLEKENVINELNKMGINGVDSYLDSYNEYVLERNDFNAAMMIISLIILAISLIEILLIVRSSFISRIKEVGIYRAIGVKKSDIFKMFMGEIIAITTLTSIPGVLFMAYVLSSIPFSSEFFTINYYIIGLTIIFVYVFNIIIGLIPVFGTVIKMPNYILTRREVE